MLEGVWNRTLKISSTSVSGIRDNVKTLVFTVRILSDHPSIL